MRGKPDYQPQIYYPIDIESWIAADHPLQAVKRRADEVLGAMRRDFEKAYAKVGRPLIPPEMLLKAILLQAPYSIRSERVLWRTPSRRHTTTISSASVRSAISTVTSTPSTLARNGTARYSSIIV